MLAPTRTGVNVSDREMSLVIRARFPQYAIVLTTNAPLAVAQSAADRIARERTIVPVQIRCVASMAGANVYITGGQRWTAWFLLLAALACTYLSWQWQEMLVGLWLAASLLASHYGMARWQAQRATRRLRNALQH
jgi:hypothetical protein